MTPRRLEPKTIKNSLLFKKSSKLPGQPVSQLVKKQFYLTPDQDKKINRAVESLRERMQYSFPVEVNRSVVIQTLLKAVDIDSEQIIDLLDKTMRNEIISQLQNDTPVSEINGITISKELTD